MPILSCHVLNCIALIHWSVDSTHIFFFFVRQWICRHPNLNLIHDKESGSISQWAYSMASFSTRSQRDHVSSSTPEVSNLFSFTTPRLWSKFWDQNWSGNRKDTRLVFLMTCLLLLFLFLFSTSCPLRYWSTPPACTRITSHLKSKSLMAHLPVASIPHLGHPFSSPCSI